ncbi:hypothetical protein [Hydrogenoanaerobacterium sp.]|nr:hypothetical protein [Hydrogenoanaerobacterium sp.]
MKQSKIIVLETFHSKNEQERKQLLQKKLDRYLKNKLKSSQSR